MQPPCHDRRITEDIPLRVGLGTRGRVPWLFVSWSLVVGPRRRLWTPRLQSLRERLNGFLGGWCIDFATNNPRTAERDTMMTAILDSCCCQNTSQTISTLSLASLIPAILTTATMIIIIERHKERPNANFCRTSTRTLHRSIIGNERTTMSETMSTAVVIAVSRTTLLLPLVPEQAAIDQY